MHTFIKILGVDYDQSSTYNRIIFNVSTKNYKMY